MKKIKLPVAWIIFLAAVCALAATVLQSARKAEQEFPMAGKNVSQLDTEQIISHVKKTQKCRKNMDLYVNGDNFDLQLTADFDLTDGGAVRFFYPDGKTTYSAQLRIFSDTGKFFVTLRSEWARQQTQYQLADYLDALKYLPQAEIRARFPDAEGFYVSLTEEGTPEDMELPLTAAEGTSFQYATVAVMTLRYFGIPARYAEGYVISEEMAADAQADEPLTVDSRCARAWAEVYQDGIGWIPMELTPGLGEMLEQKPEENPDEGDSDNAESETQPEEETTPEEDGTQEPEPDGGTVTKIAKAMLLGVLWVLLIVLLLFLLLLLRRKLIRKRREQKYQLEDINEAVCWIFADTAALMEKLGLRRGNGSMRALCEPAKQRFGDDYATALAEAIRLNDRAMFSSHALTQEQRESALKFYADTQGSLKKNVKWYHRVWIKWIQCLY